AADGRCAWIGTCCARDAVAGAAARRSGDARRARFARGAGDDDALSRGAGLVATLALTVACGRAADTVDAFAARALGCRGAGDGYFLLAGSARVAGVRSLARARIV